jgi:hypothetical protein
LSSPEQQAEASLPITKQSNTASEKVHFRVDTSFKVIEGSEMSSADGHGRYVVVTPTSTVPCSGITNTRVVNYAREHIPLKFQALLK